VATRDTANRKGTGTATEPQDRDATAAGTNPAADAPVIEIERVTKRFAEVAAVDDIVGEVRGMGYFYGIELVKDPVTRETFDDVESERLLRGVQFEEMAAAIRVALVDAMKEMGG
jgi:hypothetical protein